jgi:hypothetical protein
VKGRLEPSRAQIAKDYLELLSRASGKAWCEDSVKNVLQAFRRLRPRAPIHHSQQIVKLKGTPKQFSNIWHIRTTQCDAASAHSSTPPSTSTPEMRPSTNSFAISHIGIHSTPSCLLIYSMILGNIVSLGTVWKVGIMSASLPLVHENHLRFSYWPISIEILLAHVIRNCLQRGTYQKPADEYS